MGTMNPYESKEIRGCWATCLLSISEGEVIDYAFLEEELGVFLQAGVSGTALRKGVQYTIAKGM